MHQRGTFTTNWLPSSSKPGLPYPFQMLVADYFSLHGHNFLVIADRFTGWNAIVSTAPGKFDGRNLVTILRDCCATWNIPEHITTCIGNEIQGNICGNTEIK